MKKIISVVSGLLVLLIANEAFSAKINHEMNFRIDKAESTSVDDVEANTFVYTYYFKKLDSYYGPYAQADFLGRHNKLGFTFQRIKTDYNPEQMTFNGRVFFGRNRTYGLGFSRSTLDIDIDYSGEQTSFEFLVNLTKPSRLSFSFTQYEGDDADPFADDESSTIFGASYEIINKLRGQKYIYFGVTGSIAETETTNAFFVSTDTFEVTRAALMLNYYFNRKFSIDYSGFAELSSDLDTYDLLDQHSIGVTHYLTKSFFYQLKFARASIDGDSIDSNSIQIGMRF